jgi:hypothetical protein
MSLVTADIPGYGASAGGERRLPDLRGIYWNPVRAVLSALVLILMIATTSVDRVVCPDGCTDETSGGPSACMVTCPLCHGWSGETIRVDLPPTASFRPADSPLAAAERAPHRRSIDHPPKPA